MALFHIKNNKDLLKYTDILQKRTIEYLSSEGNAFDDIERDEVHLLEDLIIGDSMAKQLLEKLTYFKGKFKGNGRIIKSSATSQFSLFSSCYESEVEDLTIHNLDGSLGMSFTNDLSKTKLTNVHLSGKIALSGGSGGFTKTSHYNHFKNCSSKLETVNRPSLLTEEDVASEPISFGGFTYSELGKSTYEKCTVSGSLTSESFVAGFCAKSKDVTFIDCAVNDLKVKGKRHISCFVGYASGPIKVKGCTIDNSDVSGAIYLGWICGKTESTIHFEESDITESLINSPYVSSFVGAIAGSADEIIVKKSNILGSMTGNIIIAGLCPDTRVGVLQESLVDMTVTATGYNPMITHAYELFRDEDLTSNKKEISITMRDNEVNVNLIELGIGGTLNPFESVIM